MGLARNRALKTTEPANREPAPPARIYIVDDDDDLLSALGDYLGRHGYETKAANGGAALDRLLAEGLPGLVVLDVMMPGEDGLSICRRLSAMGVPVLMLSALGDATDRIVGLETGAADYLPKPFEPRELLARVRAVMRRSPADPSPADRTMVRFSGWCFEPGEHRLRRPDGTCLALTAGEARLLGALTERPGRLLGRDALINRVRGIDADVFDRSIDLLVSRLRRKLADNGLPGMIETVRGEGYRFVAPAGRRP